MMNDIAVNGKSVVYSGFVNGFKVGTEITFHFDTLEDAATFSDKLENVMGVELKVAS